MPFLDVSELLLDPDLAAEWFTVIRRLQIIDVHGIESTTNTSFKTAGSIIPQADDPMQRGPDQQNLPRLLQVITQFRLRGVSMDIKGNSYQPDLIVWNGDQYVVNKIMDFSKYGAGFIEADCSAIASVDHVPDFGKS